MKLIFKKSDLLKSLNISMRAVSVRTTLPILKFILIDAEDETIKFTSNDMEMAIETIVPGEIVSEGSAAIEAKLFYEIIRKLPENEIIIETDGNYMATISCEETVFRIPGTDGLDFPALPRVDKRFSIGLSQFIIKEMIRQTLFSLDINDNNKLMTGALLEIRGSLLRMITLDGHRIAIKKLQLSGNYDHKKVIIPGKTLNEISKILSDDLSDQMNIYFTDNHVLFEFDNTIVLSRLIDGEYFPVDNMISVETNTEIKVNRKNFQDAIERASLLIREGENKPIILEITDQQLEIKIITALGTLNEKVTLNKTGNDLRVGFNPKFFTDVLRVVDEEEISISFVNAKAPCFIRDEETYIYMILPVNIS